MQSSDAIDQLATALSLAQGQMRGAIKDSTNPFFHSKYADLASCWDACRLALSENGLSVVQCPMTEDGATYLTTTLLHSSGQWMRSRLIVQCKDDSPQAMGSGLTYARRYALAAMVGISQTDDDGNAASGRAGNDPRGDLGKDVPQAKVNEVVQRVLKLLDEDIVGDHEGVKRAAIIMDYHEKVLNADQDLYVAVGDALPAAKKNAWKHYVSLAKKQEAQEPKGKRF
jgi:ERF superfamily